MEQESTYDEADAKRYRAKRLGLLSLSAICAVLAIFLLAFNLGFLSRTQELAGQYAQSDYAADVLLIMSYDESDPNTPLARDGVLDVMSRSAVNVDVVYMNAYNAPINSSAYYTWTGQLRQKLASHGSYDAVICCDDEALTFMESNHGELFGSTPVVFFGINDYSHAMSAANSGYATGMLEQSYLCSMLKVTYYMHPDATSFTAIVDQTPAGVGDQAQFAVAAQDFTDMGVRYVNASRLSRNELASSVASTGSDTILFLLDANTDRNGNVYALDDSIAWVTSASSVPVYRGSPGGVGSGIAGSTYLDPEQDGRKAAEMTIDVLNGTSPSSIPLVVDGTLGYVFDGQVLSDHGVSTLNVPIGSTMVNRQLFSFDTLRVVVLPLALLVLALVFFMKARNLARQQLAAVAAGQDEVALAVEDFDDGVDETGETDIVEASAVEVPARIIEPAARRTKPRQLPKNHKRQGSARGYQRSLRKTHAVEKETDEPQVEDEVKVTALPEGDEVEVIAEVRADAPAEEQEAVVEAEVTALAEGDEVVIEDAEAAEDVAEPEPEPEVEAEPEPEPEDEPEPEPEDEPEPEPEPEPEDEPEPEPEPEDELEAEAEADPEDATGPEAEDAAEPGPAIAEPDIRALVGIEVCDLEEIADASGVQAEEESLRIVRKRLEGVENSCVLEVEGNRILLGFDTDIDRASKELELIEFLLRQPITVEDNTITLNSCIGAVNRQKSMDFDEMKSSVDFAINQAADLGQRNVVVFYDNNMRRAIHDREKITALLQTAIEQEDFLVFYQPQIGLHANEVVGYEALVRLRNKAYPPSQFIPVAEITGLIVEIDRIVTKRSVEQLAIWKRRNKRMRPISINFSPVHLTRDDDYVTYLLSLLKTYDVSSEYIKIEVKETLFSGSNQQKAEDLIKRLFDAGISIALDNFGMGYTSFTDIMAIPASIIKIDREFVDTFLVDGNAENFEQLVRLAHGLGRKVVVVGVDKKWQIDMCRELNCDVVQGYYFSKPLLPENAAQYKPRG